MLLINDPVPDLDFANKLNNVLYVGRRYMRQGRHIPEAPMVLANATTYGQPEGFVAMMSRIIDPVDKRRTALTARGVFTVALRTVLCKKFGTNLCRLRKRRDTNFLLRNDRAVIIGAIGEHERASDNESEHCKRGQLFFNRFHKGFRVIFIHDLRFQASGQ